uniref:Uncharacterized protein n=1 Tax=Lepeophtheirus salmonis TaxID=72036 RepID=A0A0K2UC09_LEPSM
MNGEIEPTAEIFIYFFSSKY